MISFKKSKSHFLAAIGTVLIHLVLLVFLNREFSGEQSSKLSDLENLMIEMEDVSFDESPLTSPGKDPLTDQKDKSSESITNEKGAVKQQQTNPSERTDAEQQEQALAIPDTIVPPKPEIVELLKKDSVKEAKKDSLIAVQISKLQKNPNRAEAAKDHYRKEREKFQFYQKNYRSIYNFKKVYPYALKTRELIENLNQQLATMTNDDKKKKLIKETEKMLFKQYETAVRTMSTSQGRLLLKLIARETNKTGYDIIKDYKGAFSASFWYGVGKIFNTDLKSEFHKEREDSLIESVLTKYNDNELY